MADADIVVGRRPLNNPIINQQKNPVGRSRRQFDFPLEEDSHTFGAPNKRDLESAGDVIQTWKEHQPHGKDIDHGRDFISLNKQAPRAGATSPARVRAFRSTHDARIRTKRTISPPAAPVTVDRFGQKTEQSGCSVRDLLENRYEMVWVHEQQTKYKKEAAKKEKQERLRRASPLRVRAQPASAPVSPEPNKEPFVMKRFQNISSKVAGTWQPPRRAATPTLPPL